MIQNIVIFVVLILQYLSKVLNLIDRYIIRSHIAPFIFGTGTVIFIFLMQFLMISLDQLVGKGLSEWLIIKLIVFNMSWMVILAVPMGVLFSTLMTFGSMSMAHEVTIVKASGGSLIRMMAPVLVSAAILYLALFWFNDRILPESNHQVKIMMNDIQRKKPTFALESGLFSTQLDGYTILARHVDSLTGVLSGVTIYDMTKFQNRNIISSDSGWITFTPDYKKLVLDLKNGEIHQFNANTVDNYKIINFTNYRIAMNAFGFAFEQSRADMVSKGDREMNVSDMTAIVDTAETNKSNILVRVDSLMKKAVNDIVYGKPEIKKDTNQVADPDKPVVVKNETDLAKSKMPAEKAEVKKMPLEKKITDTVKKPEILQVTKKKSKELDSDSGLTYLEKVKRKFAKAVNEGRTDINKDTVLSDKSKQEMLEAMAKEKKRIIEDSLKAAAINRAFATKINVEKSKPDLKTKKNTDTNKAVKTEVTISDAVSRDTSYNEVLNRVLQQANLTKSMLQPDINNITYFHSRSEQYKVEIYKKYAIPFACLIFVFVGAPLGVITKGGNFGISAGISLGFYIFYWACLIGGEKLADRGVLAPWLAMWVANIVVGLIGIFLTLRVNNESMNFKISLPFRLFGRKAKT